VEQRLKRFELMLIANQHQIKVLRTLRLISPPSDRARVYGETAKYNTEIKLSSLIFVIFGITK
ncbi:hypothetical protein, partial [uncultured Pseudoalteromonas sp.]|uniref:hypothetical protein n=1 Tax=uncultured Pseudoalteromonas sp. TaxID=114053 RepID=UPI00259A7BA5